MINRGTLKKRQKEDQRREIGNALSKGLCYVTGKKHSEKPNPCGKAATNVKKCLKCKY